jgi:uncharacterized membrane protein YkvI
MLSIIIFSIVLFTIFATKTIKKMVSVGTLIISIIITAIVSAVATIFVYRNNTRKIGDVADKIDGIHDIIKKKDKN